MYTLGIESSCDETSAAIVKGTKVLSCQTLTSMKRHAEYGGIIPEIATREHAKAIDYVVNAALKDANADIGDLDCVAVTQGPGLIGSLLVGVCFAKAFAYAKKLPYIGVDHLLAHLFSALLNKDDVQFPFLGVVVSGGHTQLYIVRDIDDYEIIGKTLDDAAGEALDKVGRLYGLEYPAAPHIDRMYDESKVDKSLFNLKPRDDYNVSFSGIKTKAVYIYNDLKKNGKYNKEAQIKVLSSFQYCIMNTIMKRISLACEVYGLKTIVCGGGVVANSYLRSRLNHYASANDIDVILPELRFCADNGAMVAALGARMNKKGIKTALDASIFTRIRK